MAKIILLLFLLVLPILGQEEKCDIRQAEQCAVNLQTQYDEGYMVYEAQDIHRSTPKVSDLCALVIKGSRTTRCFEDNIELCDEADSKYIKTQWEETRKDILNFCNTTICTSFQSLGICEDKIYENGIQDGQVERFCRTFNESIDCANTVLEGSCLFSMTFYYTLLAKPTIGYYRRACKSGCINLDATVAAINSCWFHNRNGGHSECVRHWNFKTCLHEKADVCPEIGKLLPRHIKYDQLHSICTTTPQPTTTLPTTTTTQPTTTITQPTTTTKSTTTPTTVTQQPLPTTTDLQDTTTLTTTTIAESTEKDTLALEFPPRTTTVLNDTNSTTTMDDLEATSVSLYERKTVNKGINSNITLVPTTEDSVKTTRENVAKVTKQPDATIEDDVAIKRHIQSCLPVAMTNSSSWNVSNLDFTKCISIISAIACLHSNISSGEDIYKLNNLLPQYVREFLKSGSHQNCENIINGYTSYVHRIEYACRPRMNTGCTGHSYGLLDCSSDANHMSSSDTILALFVFILSIHRLCNES